MRIVPRAWRFVVPAVVVGAAGLWLLGRPGGVAAGALLALLGLGFGGFTAFFFRDPERPLPSDGRLYAPGDGKVLSVAREGPAETVTVRVFLSVFDVHVQRAPCAGRVAKIMRVPGSFAAAMKDSARGNERVVMTIESDARPPVVVEQIAGLIARRIECWPRPGERVEAGARYGLISFGSQAAVHLPSGVRCLVEPGERVIGGVTPVGEWTSAS